MSGALLHVSLDVSRLMRDLFVTEQTVDRDGFMQRVSPSVKLLGSLGLIVAAALTRHVPSLLALAALTFGLALASRIPVRLYLRRILFVPAVSLLVVLPRLVFEPGAALVAVGGLAVTDAGLLYVVAFTLRTAVCVSVLVLLILTTRFSTLVSTARRLGVPAPMARLVAITYRYLFLFFAELHRMVLARECRRFTRGSLRWRWSNLGALSGTFFVRTVERGERVSMAMAARGGQRGAPPVSTRAALSGRDASFTALVVAVVLVITWPIL